MTSNRVGKERLVRAFNDRNYPEAELLALAMTRNYPHDAFGWKALGAALQRLGRAAEALTPLQKSIQLNPEDAEAYNNLGAILKDLGRLEEAEAAYRKALLFKPGYCECYNNLGIALYGLGRLFEAEAAYRQALALNPAYAETHNNLGAILKDLGRPFEAEASCRQALALNPAYAEAYSNLSVILRESGRLFEAEAHCRKAAGIMPDNPEIYNNLGAILKDFGRLFEAEAAYRRALALNPAYAEAYNNLGIILRSLGRLEEAEASYRLALSFKPDIIECYNSLGQLKKFTPDDPNIAVLRRLHATAKKEQDRIYAGFTLAKACEDIREYDEAFALYGESNALKKKQLGYNINQDIKLFKDIKSLFDVLPAVTPAPPHAITPILIVGMPRSGTSLAEQILASHARVFGAGELEKLDFQVRKYFTETPAPAVSPAAASRQITSGYLDALYSLCEGYRFVTDKMPANFRWLGFVLLTLPDAKIVHMLRNPVAVCWSNYKQCFSAKGLGFAYDLDDLAQYYRLYEDLMAFWRARFPGRIYELNYERLTENQEEETRKLLDYCGLEWDPRCLEFEKTERAVSTASVVQVRKGMYKGSSEEWRKFEKHLGLLLEGLGQV